MHKVSANDYSPPFGLTVILQRWPLVAIVSTSLVLLWWMIIAVQSIINLGHMATLAYLTLPAIAVWLYPRNALVFLLAAFYLPVGAIELPRAYLALFITVFLVRSFCSHPHLQRIHNIFTAFLLGWLFICTVMVFGAPVQDLANKLLLVHAQSVLFCLAMLLFLDSVFDVVFAIKWLCFFAGIAFLLCFCHWLWFEGAWMTHKILTTGWALIGKNTLSLTDDTRRFLWAGVDPNFYALSLIFPFFASFGLALSAHKKESLAWWMIVILCAFGILGTYSRSALLVTVVVMLPLLLRFKKKTIVGGTIVVIVSVTMAIIVPSIKDRILSIEDNIEYGGGSGRAERALAGLALCIENPFGIGLGASEEFSRIYGFQGIETSHNTYLQVLLETGPQGLFFFLAISWAGLKGLSRSIRLFSNNNNSPQRFLLSALFFGAIASAFFVATIPASDLKLVFLPSVFGYSLYYHYFEKPNKIKRLNFR